MIVVLMKCVARANEARCLVYEEEADSLSIVPIFQYSTLPYEYSI